MGRGRQGIGILRGAATGGAAMSPTLAKVTAVDEGEMTCTVEFDRGPLAGQSMDQVPLLPYDTGANRLVVIPSILENENEVLVEFLEGNARRPVVTKVFGGVEAFILALDGMEFELRRNGVIVLKGFQEVKVNGGQHGLVLEPATKDLQAHIHGSALGPTTPATNLRHVAEWLNKKFKVLAEV